MRVKHVWSVIPLPSKLKLAYSRVTLNLPITVFFILSLVQCLFQIPLHIWSYTLHLSSSHDIGAVALNSTIIPFPFAVQTGDDLFLCKEIPMFLGGPDECTKARISTSTFKRSLSATPKFDVAGTLENVTPANLNTQSQFIGNPRCVDVLPWALQFLRATSREDLVFVAFHVWFFGVSLTAILSKSIPHLVAALTSQVVATLSSAARVTEASRFQADLKRIIPDGSCNGAAILGGPYFQLSHTAEIVIGALNAVTLVAFIGLSWRLIKIYGRHSFERVHKRPEMNRLYIVVLTLCSCIQLSMFYMVAGIGLFIDQLTLGPLRHLTQKKPVYLAVDIALLMLLVPWMILGYTSVRMESKPRTIMFLAFTTIFMAAWATMFISPVYRLLFMTWNFFAMSSVIPMVLMFATLLLAIYSWLHFDLGLAEYLKAEEPIHPADKVRWSLAITPDQENALPWDWSAQPRVVWVHPQSPIATKFPEATLGRTRSHSTSSVCRSSKRSHHGGGITGSKSLTKSRSSTSVANPGVPPLPYAMPPVGFPVISIVPPVPKEVSAEVPPQKISEFAQIRLPPQAVTYDLLSVLDTHASNWARHSIANSTTWTPLSLDPPPTRRATRQVVDSPLRRNGLPSSVRPSLGSRF